MNIQFVVPGRPVPYYTERSFGGRTIKAQKVKEYQARILAIALPKLPRKYDRSFALDVFIAFQRPKRLMRQRDPDGWIEHVSKPDLDNMLKSVQDALLGPEAKKYLDWPDDCFVTQGERAKAYAPKGVGSFTFVRLYDTEPPGESWDRLSNGLALPKTQLELE